jgi:sensor domain CHASE-containing protein
MSMSLIFLIPLVAAIGAAYAYTISSRELPILLAASVAIICLVLSLILAPWQVQLLLLLGILVKTRNLSVPRERKLREIDR